jgi:hypothetical protein
MNLHRWRHEGRTSHHTAVLIVGVNRRPCRLEASGFQPQTEWLLGAWRARRRLAPAFNHGGSTNNHPFHALRRARRALAPGGHNHAANRGHAPHHNAGRNPAGRHRTHRHSPGRHAGRGIGDLWRCSLRLRVDGGRVGRRVRILVGTMMAAADCHKAGDRDRQRQSSSQPQARYALRAHEHQRRLPCVRRTVGRLHSWGNGRMASAAFAAQCRISRPVQN